MSLIDRLRRGIHAATAPNDAASFGETAPVSSDSGWLMRAIGGGKTDAGVSVSQFNSLTLPVVWACVTLIADTVAQMPVDVLRRTERGRDAQPDHPAAQLLNGSANRDMTSTVATNAQMMHTLLWGNGYQEIQRNRGQELIGLWPLRPEATYPQSQIFETRSEVFYRTTIDGRSYDLEQERVVHLKGPSYDGYCGLSPIQAARQSVGLGLALEKFGSKFFANDSKSGGFLMHPGKLGDKAVANISESFHDQGGPDNAFKVKVLEEGMKYLPTTIPPEDAQFLQSRTFQASEIARIYRVPLVMLSMIEGSTVWGTGIESILIAFSRFTLGPWLKRLEQEYDRKLLTPAERRAGFYFRFNRNALLAGDSQARAQFYNTMITIGAMTRNEARELEDMNRLDGLDEPLVPANMTGAENLGRGENDGPSNTN